MKIDFLYGTSVISMPADVKKYISRATQNDLRVLLALSAGECAGADALAQMCGITESEVLLSLAFWRGAGIIKTDDSAAQPPSAQPTGTPADMHEAPSANQLTGEEIERICREHPDLKSTIEKCQNIFSKIFTFSESGVIVHLYDHLRLDCEYILLLSEHCKNHGHASVRYLEKTAIILFDRGIDSVEKLTEHFEREASRDSLEQIVRDLYGMGTRALTAREREYIDVWANVWHVSRELIEAGYERMMNSISEPKIHYENKILKSWFEAGITDPSQIEEKDPKKTKKPENVSGSSDPSFDLDEFFKLAVERGKTNSDGKSGG